MNKYSLKALSLLMIGLSVAGGDDAVAKEDGPESIILTEQQVQDRIIAIQSLDTQTASDVATIGEIVRSESGVLDVAHFQASRSCTYRGCQDFVIDRRTGDIIMINGVWAEWFAASGRGEEVIRIEMESDDTTGQARAAERPIEIAPMIELAPEDIPRARGQ